MRNTFWKGATWSTLAESESPSERASISPCEPDEPEQDFDDRNWPPRFVQSGGYLTRDNIRNTLVYLDVIEFHADLQRRPWSADGISMYYVQPDPRSAFYSPQRFPTESMVLFDSFYPKCPGQDLVDHDFQVETRGSEAGTITLSKWIADATDQKAFNGVSGRKYPPPLCSGSAELFVRVSKLCQNGLEKDVCTRILYLANTD